MWVCDYVEGYPVALKCDCLADPAELVEYIVIVWDRNSCEPVCVKLEECLPPLLSCYVAHICSGMYASCTKSELPDDTDSNRAVSIVPLCEVLCFQSISSSSCLFALFWRQSVAIIPGSDYVWAVVEMFLKWTLYSLNDICKFSHKSIIFCNLTSMI